MTPEQRQQMFDRVCAHLKQQNERSTDENMCLYRGQSDLKCAVGCLIDDKYYDEDMEGEPSDGNSVVTAVEKSLGHTLDFDDICLLGECQYMHDNHSVMEWPERFRAIAERYNLQFNWGE